jgi:hypothetical protein
LTISLSIGAAMACGRTFGRRNVVMVKNLVSVSGEKLIHECMATMFSEAHLVAEAFIGVTRK